MNSKRTENEKRGKWKPLWVFLGICVIFGLVVNAFNSKMQTEAPKTTPKPAPTYKTVAKPSYSKPTTQRTASAGLEKQFSAWDGSHHKTVKYVKGIMKNPKSFKHVKTTYTAHKDKNYRVIIMQYRGTNSFNAVVTNTIFVQVKLNGDVVKVISQL